MALRSSSSARTPVISGVEPRGRPGMAAFGLVMLVGGIVLWVLAGQGVVPLGAVASLSSTSQPKSAPTTAAVMPTGTRPGGFGVFVDSQSRFALFASSTWQGYKGTLSLGGQSLPDVVLAPKATPNLPTWRIAFPTTPIPTSGTQYTDLISNLITAEGGSNITPVDGPQNAPIGLYQWSRLDVTAQLKSGVMVHIVAFAQTLPSGQSVLVLATDAAITYPNTEAQDFMPMLDSLVLKS
jgi:hypothetical protein